MRIKKSILLFLTSLLVLVNYAFQTGRLQEQEYNLKAAFLYRFLDYIEWPNQPEEPLRIAILGESGVYDPLLEISRTRKAGVRSVRVRQVDDISEIGPSQVVFISRNYKLPIEAVVAKLGERPALLISERRGDLERGSHINFLVSGNKLKFEINLKTASKAGIRIGSQLLQHAMVIKK